MSMEKQRLKGRSGHRARFVPPSAPVTDASVEELEERMRSASRAESQAKAVRVEAAAELRRRRGQGVAEKTVREQSGQSTRGSKQEVETASKLKDLPKTRKAFRKGEITYGHARIIVGAAGRGEIDEEELVDKAGSQPVDVFAHTVRKHEQERSADGGMSILKQQRRNRKAWINTNPGTGMTILHAELDPINGAKSKMAISDMTNRMWREEDPKNRPTTGQRMADALVELLCGQPTKDKDQKRKGGQQSVLVLVASFDPITQQIHNAGLGDGTPLPVEAVKDLACQARILPTIFDSRGQVLWAGTSRRLATPAQRMSLVARDRGCVGCGADPAWCQAHHIIPWAADGPTDIDNLCLLCSRCHHRVHDEGWQIQQSPDRQHVLQPPPKGNRRPLPIRTPRSRSRNRKTNAELLL